MSRHHQNQTQTDLLAVFSIGIQIFGSGFDPSDNTGDKPNPKAKILTINMKEFKEIMEPILLGMDVISPANIEVPTLDEIVEHVGEYELDKKIEEMDKKWDEYNNNAPTYCRTCQQTFKKEKW